jgi:ferrous iron transport protein B
MVKHVNEIKIALIGNPNVGKTVVFNQLTGARQHVGNWPGVTVEKKYGYLKYDHLKIQVVDLPGTYSLSARSIDEKIARNFIVNEKPDLVVDIIDASNLERNLYLTFLLLELEANIIIVLNMMDIVKQNGSEINIKKLSDSIGVPVIPMTATKSEGIEDLKRLIFERLKKKSSQSKEFLSYSEDVEANITKIIKALEESKVNLKAPIRWTAIKILENDKDVLSGIEKQLLQEIRGVIN